MNEFATIGTYPQSFLAHAAKNFLEEHGIRAFVTDEFTTDQSWSNYMKEDVEQAKELLATVEKTPG